MDTSVDCGAIIVEFFNDDTTSLDPDLFDQNADPSFIVKETDEIGKIGDYPILYKVSLQKYPAVFTESSVPFTISVVDPCDAPLGIVASVLTD